LECVHVGYVEFINKKDDRITKRINYEKTPNPKQQHKQATKY